MNLFKGLEKFGLKTEGTENLFEEEKRTNASTEQGEEGKSTLTVRTLWKSRQRNISVCSREMKSVL